MNNAELLTILKLHTDNYFQLRSIADKYWSFHAAVALAIAGFILSSTSVLNPASAGHVVWLKPVSTAIILILGYTSYRHMSQTYHYYRNAHKSLIEFLSESKEKWGRNLFFWPEEIKIRQEVDIRRMHAFTTICLLILLWLR